MHVSVIFLACETCNACSSKNSQEECSRLMATQLTPGVNVVAN